MTFSPKKKTEILINSLKWLYTRGNNTLIAYDSETIHKAIDEINRLQNECDEYKKTKTKKKVTKKKATKKKATK